MVEAEPDTDGLTVKVSDSGAGISPQANSERDSLKLGLSLIAALSSSFSISGGLDRGTEVMMRLPLSGGGASGVLPSRKSSVEVTGTEVTVGKAELLEPVLARLVGALAARRELSVERVSDAVLVTDAIADAAPGRFADGCVRARTRRERGRLGAQARTDGQGGAAAKSAASLRYRIWVARSRPLPTSWPSRNQSDGDYLIVRFAGIPAA